MTALLDLQAEPGVYRTETGWRVVPVYIGPTWKRNPDWDGEDPLEEFILPQYTLGWQILDWVRSNLLDDEGNPFRPTREQARLILWWYALDERGRFAYREGVIQRLKGWGKDPIAAVLCAVEFVGPCRFAGWTTVDRPDLGLTRGDPVGTSNPRAWIQIAAVSKDQTVNTMAIFPSLFSDQCKTEHGIDLGKEIIYAYHGARRIQAVTSSPRALEGGRPTFVIKNETHHWLQNNEGHAMAAVIERNATKSKGGAARVLSITNAYEPSEDSVAQMEREAYEDEAAGLSIDTGVFYDSVEAPSDAKLRPPKERKEDPDPTDDEIKAYLAAIVAAVRGDSEWLDVERIVLSILDRKNPPSRSRRFYFNQVVAAEDAWVDPAAVDAAVDILARDYRQQIGADPLRAGWEVVHPNEEVVAFFDGSKSDDATAIVGCRVSDGYLFTIGVWQKPKGKRGENWLVDRWDVDRRVVEMFERFNVVGFWADPSHALDDIDSSRYWDGLVDEWMRRYKDRLQVWPIKSGLRSHAVMFDMTSAERQKLFVGAAETFVEEMETRDDVEEYAPQFTHDGHPALMQHLKNARRYPMQFGVSLMKDNRESDHKIDLAVAAVGARLVRRMLLNQGIEEPEKKGGRVWGAW